ncbi:Phosphoglycolate phosphatase [Methylobacterium adhaesivum]|jgi:phosphoglycolate phosphatase|uniref:phosphoglycolate phosphatase n=1 Tax=Methylobacterium adhaesivum TaxID=333297 RepID=A0ABT8BG11_9HYPH|nr:HAD family hydrolase [Methylobacterium adhaesivum]MDN3590695.1 HAD family hydrolase [Methylobacterium adhaesivum]GJD29916.1 Phosphoglycolate phosphatase [Methylobacterium adhaesivum]
MGQRLSGILFDKDGTLIDFDRTWGPAAHAVMTTLADGDRARFDDLVRVSHYVEAERRFLPTSPLLAGASSVYGPLWAAALGRPAGPVLYAEMDRLFREAALRSLHPIGAPAVLAANLRAAGYTLGIATNDAEASARAQADRLGLSPHLGFVAGYDTGHGAKPGPGMVLAFAEHVGVAPGRIALVGDTTADTGAARSAGAVAIVVLSGPMGTDARDAMRPHADHLIDSIHDLPALLAAIDG